LIVEPALRGRLFLYGGRVLPFADSLCHTCRHLRLVTSRRGSTFLACQAPTLPRYPRQPVTSCSGFAKKGAAT
jgi:hypothetical protein